MRNHYRNHRNFLNNPARITQNQRQHFVSSIPSKRSRKVAWMTRKEGSWLRMSTCTEKQSKKVTSNDEEKKRRNKNKHTIVVSHYHITDHQSHT